LPLYPYHCTKCDYRFEKIQSFSAEPEHVCPKCKGALERTLTAPAFNFKGSGWYVNDYSGKTAAPAAEPAACPSSGGCAKAASCPAASHA
jgi:putative FmdB family regulatory protein